MTAWIVLGVLGGPLTLVLHELSHCVCVWLGGGRVTRFRPWPHRAESDGRWLLGSVSAVGTREPWRTRSWVAPFEKATKLASVWAILAVFWTPLFALYAWEMLDALNWMRGFMGRGSPGMDGARWRAR